MTEDTSTGFVRQRRNLILVSLVLFFVQAHRVTFEKISVFGTELTLGVNLDPLPYLWVAFFYLLWRYSTHLHDRGELGFRRQQNVKLQEVVEKNAIALLEQNPEYLEKLQEFRQDDSRGDRQLKATSSSYGSRPNSYQLSLILVDPVRPSSDQIDWKPEVTLEGMRWLFYWARAWTYVLFWTSLFSEFGVPLVIASFPMINQLRLCLTHP